MPASKASKELHPLCHEHHVEMRKVELLVQSAAPAAPAYACPQRDCAVHYGPSSGYFTVPKNGHVEVDLMPRVTCPEDGRPMYLAEVNPGKRNFRLWRCPLCESTRTNQENLIAGVRTPPLEA